MVGIHVLDDLLRNRGQGIGEAAAYSSAGIHPITPKPPMK